MKKRSDRNIFSCGRVEIDLSRREIRWEGVEVSVGGRAFLIIEVLVKAAGEIVDKRDLMSRVWPGTIVEENTLHAHISAARKALGPDQNLLKTISGRGYQLLGSWKAEKSDSEAVRPPTEPAPLRSAVLSTNLPVVAQILVGRTEDLKRLQDYLSANRMVTLTGPGGIGKTALAREVARLSLANFNGDVRFVELSSVSNVDLVASTVATALGLRIGGNEISAAAVASSIEDRKMPRSFSTTASMLSILLRQSRKRLCKRVRTRPSSQRAGNSCVSTENMFTGFTRSIVPSSDHAFEEAALNTVRYSFSLQGRKRCFQTSSPETKISRQSSRSAAVSTAFRSPLNSPRRVLQRWACNRLDHG